MTRPVLLAATFVVAAALMGCGNSQDSAAPHDRQLGEAAEGAPLAPGVVDPGVLKDPNTYQPARLAAASGGTGTPGAGPATGGDAEQQVRAMSGKLLEYLIQGEIEAALKLFNPEHVAALLEGDKYSPMLLTHERNQRVLKALPAAAAALLPGGAGGPQVQFDVKLLDGDHASVTPNLAPALFGTVTASPALAVVRQGGEWRFQLPSPLTAEDVETILAFHRQLQGALDEVLALAETSPEKLDLVTIGQIITKAMAAEPPGGAETAPEGDKPQTRPADEPPESPPDSNQPGEPPATPPDEKP